MKETKIAKHVQKIAASVLQYATIQKHYAMMEKIMTAMVQQIVRIQIAVIILIALYQHALTKRKILMKQVLIVGVHVLLAMWTKVAIKWVIIVLLKQLMRLMRKKIQLKILLI